jgi:hypothetical protein
MSVYNLCQLGFNIDQKAQKPNGPKILITTPCNELQ